MDYQYLAFFMGLFGSLHCVAMCGPLMLALPTPYSLGWKWWSNLLVYQVGRIMMYGVLGLLIGTIGNSVGVKGWQQGISIFTGLLLVSMGLFSFMGRNIPRVVRAQQSFTRPITRWIGYWFGRPGGHFMVGLLNGLLPCGMVYMALAAALNADSVYGGGVFMLLFGLGTLPALLAVVALGNTAKKMLRFDMAAWLPLICVVMGAWFLLRGANLDIPFLSPLIYPEGAMMCN